MKVLKILLACMLAFMIASCDGTIGADKNPAKLESISAKLADGKEMLVGKDFDKEKVVVTATYDDGSTKTVPSADWELNAAGFDKTKLDTPQEVNISYQGKTTSVQVTVEAYKKFVVVAVAGQSNAVGYDESDVDTQDVAKDVYRIKMLGNKEDKRFEQVDDTSITTWTPVIENAHWCAPNLQRMGRVSSIVNGKTDKGTKGIHLPLANLLLDHVPEDYGVLIVSVAYGATSVGEGNDTSNTNALWGGDASNGTGKSAIYKWGPKTISSYILQNRIAWALEQNSENKFGGIVWCQGENDNSTPVNNTTNFPKMVEQINTFLTDKGFANRTKKGVVDKSLWFVYESTYHWMDMTGCQTIWDNYKTFLGESNYAFIARDTPVNATTYTSSTKQAHFGQNAFRTTVAPAVAAKMVSAGVLW